MTPEANDLPINWGWMNVTEEVYDTANRVLDHMLPCAPELTNLKYWVAVASRVRLPGTGIYRFLMFGPGMPCGSVCEGPPEVKLTLTFSTDRSTAFWQHDPSRVWFITLPAKEPTA